MKVPLTKTTRPDTEARSYSLFHNLGYHSGSNCLPALANRESLLLFERHRRNQLHHEFNRIARHYHLCSLRQGHLARYIGCSNVKLRFVTGEKRRVAAAFFFGQDIYLRFELGMRRNGTGLGNYLPALHILLLKPAQKHPGIVSGDALVKRLIEHLDSGDRGLLRILQSDNLHLLAYLDLPALHASGNHRAASLNREDILHRHQKRLIYLANWIGNECI